MISHLLTVDIEGTPLTESQLVHYCELLVEAGNETTRNAISGGLLAFSEHPGEWEKLRADPALLPNAVEEILRWVTPIIHFTRFTSVDCEVRGVPIPAEYDLTAAIGRRIELACLANPIELRPCHNDLLNANFIDDGQRIRIVDWEYAGMGDPFFDLGNFSINHELGADEDAALLAAYDGPDHASDQPARLARLTLMRVVSDFREAMWGVLQQGISTLDVDFVAYAGDHFDRLLAEAATPRFERALRDAAG